MSERTPDHPTPNERLEELITQHQRELYLYISSLVPLTNDVQDVLQETNLALWRDMERASRVSDFRSWACRVAYNQVLAHRKRHVRNRLHFNDAVVAQLAMESQRRGEQASDSKLALRLCTKKLPDNSRRMLALRYDAPGSVRAIAEQMKCSVASVSQALYRIRLTLLKCIHETLTHWDLEGRDRP